MWAASSEFVSSSIPSWQILTAHAQPCRGARDLAFCLKVPLDSLLVWASSGGSGETARMRRLAWTFAARIADKNQIRLTRPMYWVSCIEIFWQRKSLTLTSLNACLTMLRITIWYFAQGEVKYHSLLSLVIRSWLRRVIVALPGLFY